MKLYPDRRPLVGELVTEIDTATKRPKVTARITRVRMASRRTYYIVDVVVTQGVDIEGLRAGTAFTSVSTCWLFSQPPRF